MASLKVFGEKRQIYSSRTLTCYWYFRILSSTKWIQQNNILLSPFLLVSSVLGYQFACYTHWQWPAQHENKGGVWMILKRWYSQLTLVCIKQSHTWKSQDETFYYLAKTTILYNNVGVNLKNIDMPEILAHFILGEIYQNQELEMWSIICKTKCSYRLIYLECFRSVPLSLLKHFFSPANFKFGANILPPYFLS